MSKTHNTVYLARTLYGGCGEFKRDRRAKKPPEWRFLVLAFAAMAEHFWACSQGGAKFPTGGKRSDPQARERRAVYGAGQQIRCDA